MIYRTNDQGRSRFNRAVTPWLLPLFLVVGCDATSIVEDPLNNLAPADVNRTLSDTGLLTTDELANAPAEPLMIGAAAAQASTDGGRARIASQHDTFVRSAGSESSSQANQARPQMMVKDDKNFGYQREAHLQFDLNAYEGRIESATLYVQRLSAGRPNWPITLRTTAWNGNAFNYGSRPTSLTTLGESRANTGQWDRFAISGNALQNAAPDGQLSVSLSGGKKDARGWVIYASSENENVSSRPFLELTLTPPPATAANGVRYLRLVIRAEENNFRYTRIAELQAVNEAGDFIDRSRWQVLDSTPSTAPAANLLDGNPNTLWAVDTNPADSPHEVIIDMGANHNVHAIVQTPLPSGYIGRPKSYDIYAGRTSSNWSWLAHQDIPHGDGNSAKVTYTNTSASQPQVHRQSVQLNAMVDPDKVAKRTGSGAGIARVPVGLWQHSGGKLLIEVSALPAGIRAYLWQGAFAAHTPITLSAGLNAVKSGDNHHLFLGVIGDDTSQSVNFKISGANVSVPPVFRHDENSSTDWPRILADHPEGDPILIADNISVVARREEAIKHQNEDINRLIGCYQRIYEIEQWLQYTRPGAQDPRHEFDNSRLIYLPWDSMYMFASRHYMGYNKTLSHRMLVPDEACHFWGNFHEIGHRQQYRAFTWDGAGEVTVNIYARSTAYAMMPAADRPAYLDTVGAEVSQGFSDRDTDAYSYATGSRSRMQNMFDQLWLMFGDQYVRELHRLYREDLISGQLKIGSSTDRLRKFTLYASRATGYNLDNFFTAWKFPMTTALRSELAALGLPESPASWNNRVQAVN